MPKLLVDLHIPAERFVAWYEGTVREVLARSHDGRTVRFPASVLQRYVSAEGVHGTFELTYDENHKFVNIDKLGSASGLDRYG